MSSSKRHFKVVINSKEHGLYVSSTPSSAARKAVSKLCANNKNKKVEFSVRETTQDSNKKIYGPYIGYMQKLDKPIELKGRVIRYKPIAKLKKKSRKMKGGVIKILGEGQEGIVLKPNINNPGNEDTVSKLIIATPEQAAELKAFEEKLNRIDGAGRYHVKMLSNRPITREEINTIQINQDIKNKMKKYNFKITYEYGGISIEEFLDNFEDYSEMVNPRFIQALLKGILNCFQGLYEFYNEDIVHSDLHKGNIVFLLENPEIMRMIDWGNLLVDNNSFNGPSSAPNSSRNFSFNAPSNTAPSSAPNFHHNSSSNTKKRSNKMKESLYGFYRAIKELLDQIKYKYKQNKKLSDLLDSFLKIENFSIYKSRQTAKILSREDLDGVRGEMEKIIEQISHLTSN